MNAPQDSAVLTEAMAWQLLLALSRRTKQGRAPAAPTAICLAGGDAVEVPEEHGWLYLDSKDGSFRALRPISASAADLLELCLPLCIETTTELVLGHIGQSLDGQIATASGASRYVTGSANLRHMHRLRALSDAVVVGAGTVECDDPQLTTRLVPGESPVRVVIDPSLRLPLERRIFQDFAAKTLVICRARHRSVQGALPPGTELVEIEADGAELPPLAIVAALRQRGLRRLFVEGGGITVSRFLAARALDRLHVTVCPLFIGKGRPGIVLPAVERLDQALRPPARHFMLDDDVLFDFELVRSPVS